MVRDKQVIKIRFELDEETERLLEDLKNTMRELAHMIKPTLGRTVWYRGNQGYYAMRMAFVACTTNELIQESVSVGSISPLDSDMHVHLHVITPSIAGFFTEFNVPFGKPGEDGRIPPGTWCWPTLVKND